MNYLTIPVALGSAALVSTIVSLFNIAYAARPPHGDHHGLTQITSPGSYDDDYVQGLAKLGIVKLPAHLRRALSSESSTNSPSGVDQEVVRLLN
jgi:hypothetical protein